MKGSCTSAAFLAPSPALTRTAQVFVRYSTFQTEGISLFGLITRTARQRLLQRGLVGFRRVERIAPALTVDF